MTADNKPIYLQLADKLCDDILGGIIAENERIPSVREIASHYEVNVNTAMKTIETLSGDKIIYNKRGMGYFVLNGAKQTILQRRRHFFINDFLPYLFKNMRQLNIGMEEIDREWREFEAKIL